MATTWISGAISNAVSGAVSGYVATAGSFAGDLLSGVGNGINGVGQSVEGTIRRYGDGAKDYGNQVKDWTKAPGSRVGTAKNPLGLTESGAAGSKALVIPKTKSVTGIRSGVPTGKAIIPSSGSKAGGQKALPAPKSSTATKSAAASKPYPGTNVLATPKSNIGTGARGGGMAASNSKGRGQKAVGGPKSKNNAAARRREQNMAAMNR